MDSPTRHLAAPKCPGTRSSAFPVSPPHSLTAVESEDRAFGVLTRDTRNEQEQVPGRFKEVKVQLFFLFSVSLAQLRHDFPWLEYPFKVVVHYFGAEMVVCSQLKAYFRKSTLRWVRKPAVYEQNTICTNWCKFCCGFVADVAPL